PSPDPAPYGSPWPCVRQQAVGLGGAFHVKRPCAAQRSSRHHPTSPSARPSPGAVSKLTAPPLRGLPGFSRTRLADPVPALPRKTRLSPPQDASVVRVRPAFPLTP